MDDRRPETMDDRGVSEVLGFALVFALVVSTVILVALVGFGALEETRDQEELNNAERAFDVMADNMADIHEEGAPSRATEISLESAQLRSGEQVSFNVTGVDDGTGTSFVNIFSIEPIVFASGDSEIVYSGGAIFRTQREGGFIVKEPPLLISPERVVLPIVQTRQRGEISSTSGQTVRVRAENRQRRPVRGFNESPTRYDRIIINVTSPRSELWGQYLDGKDGMSCDQRSTNNVRCTIDDPEAIYLSRSLINYAFET
jgi:hypothetical protein